MVCQVGCSGSWGSSRYYFSWLVLYLGFSGSPCHFRLVLVFALLLDFHGRLRVLRSMFIPGALHGIEASFLAGTSMRKLRAAILGVAWSRRQPLPILVRCLVCWMVRPVVILRFVMFGFGFVCSVGFLLIGWERLPEFIGSDDCARGGVTSSSRSLRPFPRLPTTQPYGARRRPGPGRRGTGDQARGATATEAPAGALPAVRGGRVRRFPASLSG